MRVIAHLSDLHFGSHDTAVVEALIASLDAEKPDLVIVSGDLTQRARSRQFAAASAFFRRLPAPVLAVPGNHDVPLYNVVRRFLDPLGRFRHYISSELQPLFEDAEIAALGLNTARAATVVNGRLSFTQADAMRAAFTRPASERFRILVLHHALMPPPEHPEDKREHANLGRARMALRAIEEAEIHLVLAGHHHRSYSGDLADHHLFLERSILVCHAGTATSNRRRTEPNAYNLLRIGGAHLSCGVRLFHGNRFEKGETAAYALVEGRWERENYKL